MLAVVYTNYAATLFICRKSTNSMEQSLFKKLVFVQPVKRSTYLQLEVHNRVNQMSPMCLFPGHDFSPYFFKNCYNITFPFANGCLRWFFPSGFPTKTLYESISYTIRPESSRTRNKIDT
jgi:hypothetical protein